jgi:transposase InsO family protein
VSRVGQEDGSNIVRREKGEGTDEGFLYLSLLMDLWPGKTVGFHAGDTLEAEGAVRALEMALKELPKEAFPVHHSDRGCQYCPHRYVGKLTERGLPVSMTVCGAALFARTETGDEQPSVTHGRAI